MYGAANPASCYAPQVATSKQYEGFVQTQQQAAVQNVWQQPMMMPSSGVIQQAQMPVVVRMQPNPAGLPKKIDAKKDLSKMNVPKSTLRKAAGKVWYDPTLAQWKEDDYRVFIGDLGNEVTDEVLASAFRQYPSFVKAKVVRQKRNGRSRGYGFVSFVKPEDMLAALKEKHLKYVGNRPIRVMRSKWKERNIDSERNKRLGDTVDAVPIASHTLRKFKIVKKDQNEE